MIITTEPNETRTIHLLFHLPKSIINQNNSNQITLYGAKLIIKTIVSIHFKRIETTLKLY